MMLDARCWMLDPLARSGNPSAIGSTAQRDFDI
jgi:hypothetical protein